MGIIPKRGRTDGPVSSISELKWLILCRLEAEMGCVIRPSQFIIVRLFHPIVDAAPLKLHHKFKLPFSIHNTTKNISLPVQKEELLTTGLIDPPLTLSKMLERRDVEMARYANSVDILKRWTKNYNK